MRNIKTFLSKTGWGGIEHVKKGQILLAQGKRSSAVFYILSGAVALTVATGGKEKIVSLLGPGSFTGKECLATARPRSMASARALTDCNVLKIEREEMLRLLENEKDFAALFRDYLIGRIIRCQELIMDHLCDSAEKRLARTLLLLANFGGDGDEDAVIPHISQMDLAEVVGTTRSRVSSFMNRFRSRGFIVYRYNATPLLIRSGKLSRWLTSQPRQRNSSLQPQDVNA